MKGSPQPAVHSPQPEEKPKKIHHFEFTSRMAASLLFLATVILFWDFLSPGTRLVLSKAGEDMTADFIGWRQFAFEELKKGHLALWYPQLLCGAPFFGDFQSALLYPPNWFFMVFTLPFAINFGIALHVFLMGWFTYLWIVQRGSHPMSAMMAAFMAMFGGAYFLQIVPGHLPNLCSMVWIPLIFLAVDGYRERRSTPWIFLGVFGFAMQILSGHVQFVYYTVMVEGLYILLILPKTDKKFQFLKGLLLMGAGAGLLTAVQLFAGWDASSESLRSHQLPINIVDIADMTPERLWCLLMPDFFGTWNHYWGGGFYSEGDAFVSLTAFILALYAFKVSPHPHKKILGGIILFLVFLAVGTRTPLFILFYKYFPLFGHFRGVSKLSIFITLYLAALSAMGLDEILKDPKTLKGLVKWTGIGGLTTFFIALSFIAIPHWGVGKLYGKFAAHWGQMVESLILCGVLWGTLFLLAVLSQKRPLLRYGFLVLSCLELFFFAKGNLPFFDYQVFSGKLSQIQKVIQADPGDYRVLVGNSYTLSTPAKDIWGEDPVIPSRYARFVALTQHCDADNDFLQKFTFHDFPPALGLLRLRYRFEEEGDHFRVEKLLLKQAPRAFLVDRWKVLKTEDVFQKAASPGFDFQQEVLLETNPGIEAAPGAFKGKLAVRDLSTDQIEIESELLKPGVLVMTDNYSKGWKGRPLLPTAQTVYQVLPANGFQIAVPLQAGKHHFMLEYRPNSYEWGIGVSILSLLVFIFLCFRTLRSAGPDIL